MAGELVTRLWNVWKALQGNRTALSLPAPAGALPVVPSRYNVSKPDGELRQGEIISDLICYVVEADPENSGRVVTKGVPIPYAIIATPDCDLLQSFRALRDDKKERINGILFFEAEEADIARKRIPISSGEWKEVKKSRLEGYHLLNDFQPGCDRSGQQIPDLLVDFKRYFMLPTKEVYRQLRLQVNPRAARRCCLGDLWREDLQQRAMSFMTRVGTPAPGD
jgi:hypothetical protein